MTVPHQHESTARGKHDFLFRRLHSLTGILFGGYIVVHLLVNATLLQGGDKNAVPPSDVYQLQVDKIHSLPFLWAIEWTAIILPVIYHSIYGTWVAVNGKPNVGSYSYAKNWLYTLQRVSAIVLILFIAFHVLGMFGVLNKELKFYPHQATASTARHIQSHWLVAYFIYPLGILAATFHLANGFWTAAIAWGLTISEAAQRRWGYVCVGLFFFTTICGMAALFAAIGIKDTRVIDEGPGPATRMVPH